MAEKKTKVMGSGTLCNDSNSHGQAIRSRRDPSYRAGPLVPPGIFASLAEFERDLIRERTMAGLESARARGRKGGRPKAMDEKKAAMARTMHREQSHTVQEICETLGIGKTTLYRYLNADKKSA